MTSYGLGVGLGVGLGRRRSGTWNSLRSAPGRILIVGIIGRSPKPWEPPTGMGLAGAMGIIPGLTAGLGVAAGLALLIDVGLGLGVRISGWENSGRVLCRSRPGRSRLDFESDGVLNSKARAGNTTPPRVRQVVKVKSLILNMGIRL